MSSVVTVLMVILAGSAPPPTSIAVDHDHDPWGKCQGELLITDEGIEFQASKEEHNRNWTWQEIQSIDRSSTRRFRITTYEDQAWKFNQDRPFNFTVRPDGAELVDETFRNIASHLRKPVIDRVPLSIKPDYEVPVKHRHRMGGGCEGTLSFDGKWVVYSTPHAKDARTWSRAREIASVWNWGPYELEIQVYESDSYFDGVRGFRFQLKEPLDEEFVNKLRRELLPAM